MTGWHRHRTAIAHASIGLALCYAVHALFVEPGARELAGAQARVDALLAEVQAAEAARDSLPGTTSALGLARAEAEAIADRGRPAREQSRLFSAVMELAAATGVQVERIAPSGIAAPATGRPLDTSVSCEIGAVGTYSSLTRFLAGLRSQLGFAAVRAARLAPVRDAEGELVAATILTEHFTADASPISVARPPVEGP